MSVDNYIDLYADSPSELIELMQKIYPTSPNGTTEERCFLNEHIKAFVHSKSAQEIQWNKDDYNVNVNHTLSFRYFSNSDCNSDNELKYVMKQIVHLLNCDLLYRPNGDEPVMIQRSGVLIFDNSFDRYFGKGASDSLQTENRINIIADMSMEEIMKRCEDKFGDSLNWFMLPDNKREEHFVAELKLELGEDDPFFDGNVYAIYKCEANDDMLFVSKFDDGHKLWRIYHLTYSHCRECEGFPRRKDFADGYEAARYIIDQFIEESTYL